MAYSKVDFNVMRETGYGVMTHWTTWTYPKTGLPKKFDQAVNDFDVDSYIKQIRETGAGHVVFTSTHQLHWIPGPNPEVDRILPGRTCKHDLLMELADGLLEYGIKLIIYYHHAIGKGQDPEWREAAGGSSDDHNEFYDNYCRIVSWMGAHYGKKAIAFWFDAGYDLNGFRDAPWERLTEAAKKGNPDRLVTYNSGIERMNSYTEYQDYWAGEINRLNYYPRSEMTPAGLPLYALTGWHPQHDPALPQCGDWGIDKDTRHLEYYPPAVQSVVDYYDRFRKCKGVVAFNLLCYQEGIIYENDLNTMKDFREFLLRREER